MLKIAHVRELATAAALPIVVVEVIREAVTVLDSEYGETRDVDSDYGGYVLVVEDEGELPRLQEFRIDVKTAIPEYVDVVVCDGGKEFASCLILQGSDFGVLLVMPLALLPESLRQYITQ